MKDSFESERSQSRDNHRAEIDKLKEDYQEQLQAERKDLTEQLASEKKSAREEINKLKDELYDQTGKKSARESQEKIQDQTTFTNYRNMVNKEADKKVDGLQKFQDEHLKEVYDRTNDKVEKAVALQKHSAELQIGGLQDELAQYRSEGKDVESAKAKAKGQVIEEFENDRIKEQQRIAESYERTINRMKENEGEKEDRFNRRSAEIVFNADDRAKKMLKDEKAEFHQIERNHGIREKYLEATFNSQLNQEKFKNTRGTESLVEKQRRDMNSFSESKDAAFNNYLNEKNAVDNYEIGSRQAKIDELKTTDDPLKVSPLVVKRIHDNEERRFTAERDEEASVHLKNLQAEKDRDATDRRAMLDGYQKKFAQSNREKQKVADTQSKQFMNTFQEMKDMNDRSMTSLTERSRRSAEMNNQKSNIALTETQQRAQEALEEQRDNLQRDKTVAVDDAEKTRKNSEREWQMKTHDLRRSLEQKLSDERDQHEKGMSELRLEYDKKLRDANRTSNRALEDRVKSYEHQIKQQELSFKERERFLTEHYEEELDRMKRSNAQLIQKKS